MATPRVNRQTNVKPRDEDVDKKLRLYGIVQAFRLGKLPSNDQIDTTLNSLLTSRALSAPSSELSPEGRAVVADIWEVVSQAKYLVLSKNQGNLLQDFVWQTSHSDYSGMSIPGTHGDKAAAKEDCEQALHGLKTLGSLIITNGQFRKLVKDASILLRDVGADGASKVSSNMRPDERAWKQIGEPAAANTWHEAHDLSKENMKNMKSRARAVYKKNQSDESGADGTDDGAKSKPSGNRARARDYLSTKIPKECRDHAILRIKKMVLECQKHPDYQQAVQTLLDLAGKYQGHPRSAASDATSAAEDTRKTLTRAETNLKTLIERFANGTSTDGLWNSISAIYDAASKDSELNEWFGAANRLIRRCLQDKGYIFEENSTIEWKALYGQGKYLLTEKYKVEARRVVDEINFIGDQFELDPQNKAFGKVMNKLFTDLVNEETGKLKLKPHLITDLTSVILPAALEGLAYIPIPRIEYSDPQLDLVIDNLVFESDNFMPNLVEVFNSNYLSWGRKMAKVGKNTHTIQVKVAGIQADLRNVSYYVKRKRGFPSVTDIGIFSALMAGSGFGFHMALSTADTKDPQHFFKVDSVHVDIDHLKLQVHKSRHKLLLRLFKPIVMRALRPALRKTLKQTIKDSFRQFDATLYDIKNDADSVSKTAEGGPDNPDPSSYNRLYQAACKRFIDDKQKKEADTAARKAEAKTNFAFTMEDSILPSIQLPGGFSVKATEFKVMAGKGETWQSPVFALGSAGKSSDIPPATKIERKPVSATSATGNLVTDVNYDLDFADFRPNATLTTTTSTDVASTTTHETAGVVSPAARRFL